MAERVQTYKNHRRTLYPFHLFVLPVLLIHFLNTIRHFYLAPSRATGWSIILALAFLLLAVLTRVMVTTVQNRVIRLEMRLRLADVLPPELQPRLIELTVRQLVPLRFASDAELPALVRDVLDGRLTKSNDIKKQVKNWQADW